MNRRANPDHNGQSSFVKTLEFEAVYLMDHETFKDVTAGLPVFIDEAYNTGILDSASGHVRPTQLKTQHARHTVRPQRDSVQSQERTP